MSEMGPVTNDPIDVGHLGSDVAVNPTVAHAIGNDQAETMVTIVDDVAKRVTSRDATVVGHELAAAFTQAGLSVPEDEVARLAADITRGSPAGP
ncbi:MAG: hypothetical protein IPI32_07255 [Austwickia sp.]|nr:hypothetical protein [Austwickia sp.]MBK9102387.1 hypothetical protein [Austwickia sp.]